jgi:elongation factor P
MSALTDIKTGAIIKVDGNPCLVVWNQFNRKQQRKPVMRTKMRNVITGATFDKTFLSGEVYEFADIENRHCQYMYADKTAAFFLDNQSYEQFELSLDQVEGALPFLKDDTEVKVTFYEGKAVGVQPPIKVTLKVTSTSPGVKGDSAGAAFKQATLETGVVVDVPLFINEGEMLIINTETQEYVGRDSGGF